MTHKTNSGFTLIELSIVLVIIGLIIGGILVGQDMIKIAEVRSTVAQVEKYNSAVNTFRSKFNAMPGDMPQTSAAYFGLFQLTDAASLGQGDGNGLIEGGAANATEPLGETLVFWRHLSDASLIDGSMGTVGNSIIVPATGAVTATVTNIAQSLPPSKISANNYFIVYAAGGVNYYQIIPITSVTNVPSYVFSTTGLTPIQSFYIDTKLDDGQPNTGVVQARDPGPVNGVNGLPSVAAISTANTCTVGTGIASDTYNRSIITGGYDHSCSLRLRFN